MPCAESHKVMWIAVRVAGLCWVVTGCVIGQSVEDQRRDALTSIGTAMTRDGKRHAQPNPAFERTRIGVASTSRRLARAVQRCRWVS
jgi:hypothetical protein